MSNRNALLSFVWLSACVAARANGVSDTTIVNRLVYANRFQSGLITGHQRTGPGATLEMMHGVRYGRLAVGGTVGMAGYNNWLLFPAGLDASFDMLRVRGNAVTISVNGGRAIGARPLRETYGGTRQAFDRAWNWGGGLGYRWSFGKFSLYLSGGYRFERISYTETYLIYYYGPYDMINFPGDNRINYKESNRRFVFQIGFGLH